MGKWKKRTKCTTAIFRIYLPLAASRSFTRSIGEVMSRLLMCVSLVIFVVKDKPIMFRIGLRFTGDDEYWVAGFPIKNEHFEHNNALLHQSFFSRFSSEQLILIRLNSFFFFSIHCDENDAHIHTLSYFVWTNEHNKMNCEVKMKKKTRNKHTKMRSLNTQFSRPYKRFAFFGFSFISSPTNFYGTFDCARQNIMCSIKTRITH